MDQSVKPSYHAQGWSVSVILHALCVAGALLMAQFQPRPLPDEPFRWEVVMHQSQRSTVSPPEAPPSEPPPRQPVQERPSKAQTVQDRPIQDRRVMEQTVEKQPVRDRTVERRDAAAVEATASVAPPLNASMPVEQRSVSRSAEVIQHEVQRAEEGIMEREVAAVLPEPSGVATEVRSVPESVSPTAVSSASAVLSDPVSDAPHSPTVSASTPISNLSNPVERGEVVHKVPTQQRAFEDGLVERPAASVNRHTQEVEVRVAAHGSVPRPQWSRRDALESRPTAKAAPGSQAHYGWLKELLQSHIERMKRYPQLALDRKLEGRVVVRAVMWNDGTLTDLEVLHSSGHDILDDEALKLLGRLSPVSLTYDLGKESITVKIPISYGIQ